MEFEWDEAKALSNIKDHGVPFEIATFVFEDATRIERVDQRTHYVEDRWVTVGFVDRCELVVVYTMRGDRIRIISARKASPDERREYWQDRSV